MCAPRTKEIKTAESALCTVSTLLIKNETHMHAQARKYKLRNFSDSTYKLNILTFASKTDTAPQKDKE